MVRVLPLLILFAWPIAEIAAFILVGSRIGVLATIGLILLTGVAGSLLLRSQGVGVLRRVQDDVAAGRDPGREIVNGVMILLAGVLLLLPGFVTDIVGILLFLPPVRAAVWRLVKDRIAVVNIPGGFNSGGVRRGPTIDLDPDDYSRAPSRDGPSSASSQSPWRQIDHED